MAKRTKNRARNRRTYRKKKSKISKRKRMNRKRTKKRNNKQGFKSGGGGVSDIRTKPLFDIKEKKYSDQIVFGINPNLRELLKCFTDDARVIATLLGRFKGAFYIPFYTTDDILASFDENKELLFLAQTVPLKIDSGKIFKIKIDDLNNDLAIQNILSALTILNQGQTGGVLEGLREKAIDLKERFRKGTEKVQKAISEKTSEFGQKIKEFSFKRSLGDLFITLVQNLTGKFRKGVHEISLFKTEEEGIHRINISIVPPNGKESLSAVLLESRGIYREIKPVLEERERLLLAISEAATPDNLDVVSEKTEKACIKDEKRFRNNKELKNVLSETQKLSNYMGEIKAETSETSELSPTSSQPASPPTEPTSSSLESAPPSGPSVEPQSETLTTLSNQQAIENARSRMANDPETKKNNCEIECKVKHEGDKAFKERRTQNCMKKCV